MPRLSIITVSYNNLVGLQETSRSVLIQNGKLGEDFNWVIIDGGSTDGTADFLNEIAGNCFFVCSEKDGGIYEGMNKGVEKSNGEFVLFLNSGDILVSPDTIRTILPYLNDKIDILRCGIRYVKNGKMGREVMPVKVMTGRYLFVYDIAHQGTFIRRSLLHEYPYNTRYRIVADWDFFCWAYLVNNVREAVLSKCITNYDISGMSSRHPGLKFQERRLSWLEHFGELSYKDYQQLCFGANFAERVVVKSRGSVSCEILCCVFLFPVRVFLLLRSMVLNAPFFIRHYLPMIFHKTKEVK